MPYDYSNKAAATDAAGPATRAAAADGAHFWDTVNSSLFDPFSIAQM